MRNVTFKDLYEEAKTAPTPAQEFVERVAKATFRSEGAVRAWLCGRQVPDPLALDTLGRLFDADPASLFPESNEQK